MRSSSGETTYEVVVIGAGPAGSAAAAAAARQGRTVALLHSPPGPHHADPEPYRIGEGAAPGTAQLIDEIFGRDASAFAPGAHLPCPATVSAWGQPEPVTLEHMANPLGYGWNLDRPRFDADLRAGAGHLGVDLRAGARVTAARRHSAGWTISYTTGGDRARSLEGEVIVDASGRGSPVAHQQGARRHRADRLVALWSVWSVGPRDLNSSTYVEAVEGGWWYSVLLGGQRRMVVHLTDVDLLATDPQQRRHLAASARRLGLIGSVLDLSDAPRMVHGPRLATARSGWLDRFAGTAWFSAGDAAVTFDPLSGRGITAALLTGRAAGLAAAAAPAAAEAERHRDLLTGLLTSARAEHHDAYRAEMRWPASEFWARRHRGPDRDP